MKPHTHLGRYSELHRQASRKGYKLVHVSNNTWALTHATTGEPSAAGENLSLDDVAVFLMSQRLIG